jgi:ketosteroid isomerase-like protein
MVTCAHDRPRRAAPRARRRRPPVSDAAAVEAANARFYRAFETLDIDEMEQVWVHAERARCVHPGWPLLGGWEAVRASWQTIFENTEEMRFTLSDVTVDVDADLAWVTCTENILSEVAGRVSVTAILATNLFERTAAGWRLVHHHASHVLTSAP